MIGIILFTLIIGFLVIWHMKKRNQDKTYTEFLITYPFEGLKKGKVAVFKSDEVIKAGDFVLIRFLGSNKTLWKVTKVEGDKLWLTNRMKEELPSFPNYYVCGKMVGYKGEKSKDAVQRN